MFAWLRYSIHRHNVCDRRGQPNVQVPTCAIPAAGNHSTPDHGIFASLTFNLEQGTIRFAKTLKGRKIDTCYFRSIHNC